MTTRLLWSRNLEEIHGKIMKGSSRPTKGTVRRTQLSERDQGKNSPPKNTLKTRMGHILGESRGAKTTKSKKRRMPLRD